ncbi:uncharacterized protein DNG_04764 [Cephalotrichum gorgonifer]|uniref:SWR1-complex protein 3 domain-containing protein n=1 Tax=Cephalotrichum gorgonifer TaxID=2041049 RepID=A0AAE8MWP4_9PEZI|nr:uncharacterized protein DNG_04764 [Cephalotrichum gorgonifer]
MERKRKLPARAAARNEQASKKRTATPPEKATPAATPAPEAAPIEEPRQIPKSIQPGKPLPTVEELQPENLPIKEYQTIQESGVLQESLRRSRQKWMTELVFEKYWTKPVKKKGVVIENPKNPPKESMTKLGQVTITIEPHVFDATLYAIKDPKPPAPATSRPVLQYGPPGGTMPLKAAKPPTTPSTPARAAPATKATKPADATPGSAANASPRPIPKNVEAHDSSRPNAAPSPIGLKPGPPPPASITTPTPASTAVPHPGVVARPPSLPPMGNPSSSRGSPAIAPHPVALGPPHGGFTPKPVPRPTPPPPPPGQANNAVITTLAERATSDDTLKELMRKVADGIASKEELAHFQGIIDKIHEEQSRKNSQQAPPADKVFVDGRSLKYFAEEVKTILQIVLGSNPQQRSTNLRPPPGSDTLIVMLVQAALDDAKLKETIHRIANGKPDYPDTLTLKSVLDGLHKKLLLDKAKKDVKQGPYSPSPASNGAAGSPASTVPATNQAQSSGQQALRSKGPPPAPKPDISAIAVEFAGGNGDRYLFPKFSILEYRGTQRVVASFLVVRKSSQCEYGGDQEQDYYEPMTIRLFTSSGRHLENLARVVAPQDEVVRYMDDIMSSMTRAQYVLLAWRLMRERAGEENAEEVNGSTSVSKDGDAVAPSKPGVLWTTKMSSGAPSASDDQRRDKAISEEDEDMARYQKLIRSAAAKDDDA